MSATNRWFSHVLFAGSLASLVGLATAAPADDGLSGRWVVAQLTTTVADVPVVGEIEARTRMVTLHDLAHEGDRLRGKGRLCRLDIDSGTSLVETKLPAAFLRSLPPPHIDALLAKDGGFRTGRSLVVVGARLDDPDEDPLPTSPRDERVFDQDRDGKPGVTIVIDGIVEGEIYVAQRSFTRLLGKVDGGVIAGTVFLDNEQVILGATSSMLDDPPKQRPLPSKSWFKMVRVSESATCEEARKMSEEWLR